MQIITDMRCIGPCSVKSFLLVYPLYGQKYLDKLNSGNIYYKFGVTLLFHSYIYTFLMRYNDYIPSPSYILSIKFKLHCHKQPFHDKI